MKINFNPNGQMNGLNVERINQSLHFNDKNYKSAQGAEKQERRDRAVLSPMGKAASLLESLMKQKEKITESKNELIGKTLENGGTIEEIKAQLELYDEQLKNIEEQINAAATEQPAKDKAKAEEETEKNSLVGKTDKPKTEAEVKTEVMNSNVELSAKFDQAEELLGIKESTERRIKTLEGEIALDKSRGAFSAEASSKEELVERLGKSVVKMQETMNETTAGALDKIKENNELAAGEITDGKMQEGETTGDSPIDGEAIDGEAVSGEPTESGELKSEVQHESAV